MIGPEARELLARLLPPSDDPPTEEEIQRERRRRFDVRFEYLKRNRTTVKPAVAASVALSAATELSRMLRAGSWPASMDEPLIALLTPHAAAFGAAIPLQLGSLNRASREIAADIFMENVDTFCKAAFGVSFRGRPTNDAREEAAVSIYVIATDWGLSEEHASMLAFDAYFGEGAYSRNLKKACGKEDGCRNQAEQSMKKVILPLLRRAEVRKKSKAGRKPKR